MASAPSSSAPASVPLPSGMTIPAGAVVDQGQGNINPTPTVSASSGGPANSGPTNIQPGQNVPNPTNIPTTVANPGGAAPGTSAPQTTLQPVKTSSQIQSEADALASQPVSTTSNTRTSSQIESDFQNYLTKLGNPPTAPDTTTEQTNLNATPGGVNDIQSQLSDASATYASLENSIQQKQASAASKPGVIAALINGRMKMISAEDASALAGAKANVSALTTSLKNANTAVQTIMKNTQTDYTNSVKAYDDAYTKAYQAFTSAESNMTKDQAAASANAKVIISSFKGSAAGVNSITPDQEAQWNVIETQAGLPQGFIKAAVQAELNITKWVKGSDGNIYVEGVDPNGIPYTAKVGYGGGTTAQANANNGSSKTATKSDIQSMSSSLDGVKGTDGYISPSDWETAMNAWTNAGYSASSFITDFKNYANPQDVYTGLGGNKKANPTATSAALSTGFQ